MSEKPNRTSILVAEFRFTDDQGQQIIRLCTGDSPFSISSADFLPDDKLAVDLPARNGTLLEDDTTVVTSSSYGFVLQAAQGRAFNPIECLVYELLLDENAAPLNNAEIKYLDRGSVVSVEVNPSGRVGEAEWTIRNVKALLEIGLDSIATDQCNQEFGGGVFARGACGFDLEAASSATSIVAIEDHLVTVSSVPSVAARWFELGTIDALNTKVTIRKWKEGTVFEMFRLPPQAWVDELTAGPLAATLRPGCDKSLNACRQRGQEDVFRGIGIEIPRFQPNFERPLT